MNTVELRRWAIQQAVALNCAGRDARGLARDFLDFVNENDDATVAAATRKFTDKLKLGDKI